VCCSVLQCVAVCCSVLQCVAVCCSVLQYVAVCCSVLQCVAVHGNDDFGGSGLCTATHCNTLQLTATHCQDVTTMTLAGEVYTRHGGVEERERHREIMRDSVLQCVAVCCSVLQCVAVCCSVLHQRATQGDHERQRKTERVTK